MCISAFKKKRWRYCEGNISPLFPLLSVLWFTCTAQSHSVWSKHGLRACISQPCFTYIILTITHQQLQLQSLGPPNASDQTSSHLFGVPNRGQHVTRVLRWKPAQRGIQGLTDRWIQESTPQLWSELPTHPQKLRQGDPMMQCTQDRIVIKGAREPARKLHGWTRGPACWP